jgi:hypothetical protein
VAWSSPRAKAASTDTTETAESQEGASISTFEGLE